MRRHHHWKTGFVLIALSLSSLTSADSTVSGIYSAVDRSEQDYLGEAARRAHAEAGWWFARHANLTSEFPGFRGYFIKVRNIGKVRDRFGIGAIVTGERWDRSRAPSFAISFDPGGPSSQYVAVENLAYLGAEWHPDFLKIRERIAGTDALAAPTRETANPGVFGVDRGQANYIDRLAREAISRAGRWMPDNPGAELAGFRGYFIKVRNGAGGVDDNFNIGAIVRGSTWDGTTSPQFRRHQDPGGPEEQWISAGNLTYLGTEWNPDFERLHEHLRTRAPKGR